MIFAPKDAQLAKLMLRRKLTPAYFTEADQQSLADKITHEERPYTLLDDRNEEAKQHFWKIDVLAAKLRSHRGDFRCLNEEDYQLLKDSFRFYTSNEAMFRLRIKNATAREHMTDEEK